MQQLVIVELYRFKELKMKALVGNIWLMVMYFAYVAELCMAGVNHMGAISICRP